MANPETFPEITADQWAEYARDMMAAYMDAGAPNGRTVEGFRIWIRAGLSSGTITPILSEAATKRRMAQASDPRLRSPL